MATVDVNAVKPGMVVVAPVYGQQGAMLLKAGSVLTEKNVWVLKSWGVAKVEIQGDLPQVADAEDQARAENESDALDAEIGERLSVRFAAFEDDAVMQAIKQAAFGILKQRHLVQKESNDHSRPG